MSKALPECLSGLSFPQAAKLLLPDAVDKTRGGEIFKALKALAPCDDRPRPLEALQRLVDALFVDKPLALSQVPRRGVNDDARLRLRSLPLEERGLELEVAPVEVRVPGGWKRRMHFRIERWSLDGPRALHDIERLAHGLVGAGGAAGLDEQGQLILQHLPAPSFEVPRRWSEWRELLECLEDIEALKGVDLPVVVVDGRRDVDGDASEGAASVRDDALLVESAAPLSIKQEELLCATPLQLFARGRDWEVELDGELGDELAQGAVAFARSERRRLVLRAPPGRPLPRLLAGEEVRLVGAPDSTCLDRQREALEVLLEGRATNSGFVQALINPCQAVELDEDSWTGIELGASLASKLDASQRRAVEIALSRREVSLVWGPPGTGKTQAIVAMCLAAVRAGLRVLVTSQSNVAVDNAIQRLMAERGVRAWRMPQRDGRKLQAAVSPVVGSAAVTSFLERVEPLDDDGGPQPASSIAAAVERFLADSRKLARVQARANENLLDQAYRCSANIVGATCSQAAKLRNEHGLAAFDLVVVDEVSKATLVEMLPALVQARKAVFVGDHHQLPPVFKDDEVSLRETIEQSAGRLDADRVRRAKELVDQSWFQQAVDQCQQRQELLVMLDTQYRAHPRISAAYAPFYGAQGGLRDGVRAEERALPMPVVVAGRPLDAKQGIVWFDTARIGREAQCGVSRRNEGEARFIVEALQDLGEDSRSHRPDLWTRGRIEGRWVGRRAIDLREHLDRRLVGLPGLRLDGLHPALWVDGIEVPDDHELREGQRHEHGPALDVAVATFYKAQKALLQSMAKASRGLVGLRLKIDSVDSFQGAEADVVFLSLVRTGFRPDSPFVTEFRRVNVAMSRARRLLCLVGALDDYAKARVPLPGEDVPIRVYEQIQGHIRSCAGIHRA
jgi:hypothetical protein